jgi:peroxiredoxin
LWKIVRGAGWLGELQRNLKAFEESGAEIWAISPDPAPKLAKFASKEGIGFDLLSDQDLGVITGWGLVNPSNPKVPHPTAVIIDTGGTIRYLRQDVDYTKRPLSDELLEALDAIGD